MVWNVGDLASHLASRCGELARLRRAMRVRRRHRGGTAAAVDNYLIAEFPVRDMVALAEMFDVERKQFVAALSDVDPDYPVPAIAPNATARWPRAIFVVDHNNHGTQLAEAGARPWTSISTTSAGASRVAPPCDREPQGA
jgi:hypothetical protein